MFTATRTTKKESIASTSKAVESAKKVDNNTYQIKYKDGSTAIRLHTTDVITITDNKVILDSGGWRSNTTKNRINSFVPTNISIRQKSGLWYVETQAGTFDYFDRMSIDLLTGKPDKEVPHEVPHREKRVEGMKKRIDKFVQLITADNLPEPSNGDCWYCLLRDEKGVIMGDNFGHSDHLESHMKEKYLHGSLLVNAMRDAGYSDTQIGFHYGMKYYTTFRKAVKKYLRKRLIPELARS